MGVDDVGGMTYDDGVLWKGQGVAAGSRMLGRRITLVLMRAFVRECGQASSSAEV